MAITDMAQGGIPQDDADLERMLNNKALQDLMNQEAAAQLGAGGALPTEVMQAPAEPVDLVPTQLPAGEEELLRTTLPSPVEKPVPPGFWEGPLAAGTLGGGMPRGLGQLIKPRLPGVPSAGTLPALPSAIRKAAPPALSRGLPGVPGSKAVGKAIGKTPGLKQIGKGIGKLFGRR